MKKAIFRLIVLLAIMPAVISGCGGSDNGENANDGIRAVGIITCYNCHADGLLAKYANLNIFSSWLRGPHGNYQSSDGTDKGALNDGYPSYSMFSDDTCQDCHDGLADGLSFEEFYTLKGVDYLGRVGRPVVGCESCHGGGAEHFGKVDIPYPKPDHERCGKCHNSIYNELHSQARPERKGIYEDYKISSHKNSINEHTLLRGSNTVNARCSRCHTDEGAMLYLGSVSGLETKAEITTLMDGKRHIEDASPVECRTCHRGHDLKLLGSINGGLPSSWSIGLRTCVSCHQIFKSDGGINLEAYHDPNVNSHGSLEEILSDTHYDNPSTALIEGYILTPNSEHNPSAGNSNTGTCLDCHNPHDADIKIHKEWAGSAHGGHISGVKEEGGRDAGVSDTSQKFSAWAHYDFKGSNRAACQRCHTATGLRNFLNSPQTYNPSNNVFSASDMQKELLYCYACHTDNKGGLRNPGKFSITALYKAPSGRIEGVPDMGGSNICMTCHSGRESGQEIKDQSYPADIVGKNFGSFNSHYLPAGGILFRAIGYEFEGRDYSNVQNFEHDKIGISLVSGAGINGPCVGCHMKTEEGHGFLPVKKDEETGIITEIPANAKICSICHIGKDAISADRLNELEEGYEAALDVLVALLAEKGIYFGKGHPYFFNTSEPALQTAANAFKNWPDKDTLGSAFNLNMFKHMPGAHVHNSHYTKKLIYDSIDFMDDGLLNLSVEGRLGAGAAYDFLK